MRGSADRMHDGGSLASGSPLFEWRRVTAFLPMVLQAGGRVTEVRAVQSWKDLVRVRVKRWR